MVDDVVATGPQSSFRSGQLTKPIGFGPPCTTACIHHSSDSFSRSRFGCPERTCAKERISVG